MDELFTFESLVSLQGSAAAALLVPNVVGFLVGEKFDPFRKWTSLAIAMVLAYVAAFVAGDGAMTWLVAFFNGLMIFASAMGINQLPKRNRPKAGKKDDGAELDLSKLARFFKSWI
ncbi:MAG: hypothetical protein ACRD0P_05940 [Stackebrandtia sp.]